ncbi:hypothetical protein AGMMS49593_08160 [Endomicrobiia bacterium]|nr:hypothetical protein AGMMS49593_08160 [Endomicrobiia bacterium]
MRSKGFALLELIIIIVIIGVLSIVAIPVYKSYINKTKIAQNNAGIEKSAEKEISKTMP